MIVLGIDTSTSQTSVALGAQGELVGAIQFAGVRRHDDVVPAVDRLVEWTGLELGQVGGVAVGIGPGLYTGLRVGVEAAKTFAQVLRVPIVARVFPRRPGVRGSDHAAKDRAVLDARRGEVFFAFYRAVPGGVMREGEYRVDRPGALAAELEADPEQVLLVGNGAMLYRRVFEEPGVHVGFAPAAMAHPWASALVELSAARFIREETDRPADVVPLYLRKTDAEIGWDRRARGASA